MNATNADSVSKSWSAARRRGALLIAVMVCLFVVMTIAGTIVRTLIAEHRQSRVMHRRTQAAWLVSAGAERAAARLRTDPAYLGETWRIPAEQLEDDAVVSIVVQPAAPPGETEADEGTLRHVVVEAAYPAQGPRQINLGKQFRIRISAAGDES
jgi:hypothetical protein